MKILALFCALAALLASTFAPLARGQSLAEFARKERARRAKESKAVKVYTNDNIPHVASITPTAPAETAPAAAPAPIAEPSAPGMPPPSPEAKPEEPKAEAKPEAEKEAESKEKTQDYWQAKFKAAREAVAQAEEQAKLSSDETNLLQMRVTRELDPQTKSQLQAQLDAQQATAKDQQAALDDAKKALDDLEQEFKASGAPEDWSKTD
jgi:type IV secretory pathway VirB10-like protein